MQMTDLLIGSSRPNVRLDRDGKSEFYLLGNIPGIFHFNSEVTLQTAGVVAN